MMNPFDDDMSEEEDLPSLPPNFQPQSLVNKTLQQKKKIPSDLIDFNPFSDDYSPAPPAD